MADLHVLRVFVNEDDEWGNPLGVFLRGAEVPAGERQRVAADLGFSETVFIDDAARGEMRIFTPTVELPFAGHPTVGAAWLLTLAGHDVEVLRPPAGEVAVRLADAEAFVAAPAAWAPPFAFQQLESPLEVRALPQGGGVTANTYCWAWIDEVAGTIRARGFVPEAGIEEDEATGSAALALCDQLGRSLVIHQGRGSVIACAPGDGDRVEVGGRACLKEVRDCGS